MQTESIMDINRIKKRIWERAAILSSMYANWGFDHTDIDGLSCFLREWCETVTRDFNHPAIVCWRPFNETWDLYKIFNRKVKNRRIVAGVKNGGEKSGMECAL